MIFSIFAEYAVTPFVGVWIETLKSLLYAAHHHVTPFVGVWIETQRNCVCIPTLSSHTLRGCVD